MSNPWFRLYSEFANDPKVQMLSEQDQRRLIMLFCIRCNSDVTLQDKHVTFQLRISSIEWTDTKNVFIEAGFIDKDNNILNWNKRQYVSDSSTSRVARHRALHKDVNVTKCNVTVTPPEQNRTDTEQIHKQSKQKDCSTFVLPDWINEVDWNLWIKTRKGKKLNDEQKQGYVDKLWKWMQGGMDYQSALKDAALAGWQGLHEPKAKFENREDKNRDIADHLAGKGKYAAARLD
jgi:hypothetical protein